MALTCFCKSRVWNPWRVECYVWMLRTLLTMQVRHSTPAVARAEPLACFCLTSSAIGTTSMAVIRKLFSPVRNSSVFAIGNQHETSRRTRSISTTRQRVRHAINPPS